VCLSVSHLPSIISCSCFKISWAEVLIHLPSWNYHDVRYFADNCKDWEQCIYVWSTINSILAIRTDINTTTILLLTILHSSALFTTFQSLFINLNSWVYLALTWLVGITFAGLSMYLAISYPITSLISTKIYSNCIPITTGKHSKDNSCNRIYPCVGWFTNCPCINSPIHCSSNSSCSKMHLNINVGLYGSFGHLY